MRWEAKVTRLLDVLTVLFAVEFFDAVAGVVVLTEDVLLLGFVKDGLIVPRNGGLGMGSANAGFALQNVDCTRNGGNV